MNVDTLYDAIGEIQSDYILDAETPVNRAKKFRWKPLIAACLAVLLTAMPVRAEIESGYVSNLLAPLYGGAQTELVDKIGIPIEASTTVGDYALTAQAIIGDKYNVAIVYTLTRTDGGILEEGLYFAGHTDSIPRGSGGGTLRYELSEDGTQLQIVYAWSSTHDLRLNRLVSVCFSDLMKEEGNDGEPTLVEEGDWELQFVLRYEDTSVSVPVNNQKITDTAGTKYTIKKILLSPVGLHIEMTVQNRIGEEEWEAVRFQPFSLSVLLKDDTLVEVEDWNLGTSGGLEDATLDGDFGALFDEPIPLENIKALILCGTTIPVDIS